jgi:hypothetical protein
MTNYFVSDDEFLFINAAHRFKKLIQQKERIRLSDAMARCGVGLTHRQFFEIVQRAVDSGWCSMKDGRYGGTKIIFNQAFKDVLIPDAERLKEPEE